ncbi:MAG TPA: glycosyltransferase [Acidimicrobiales bacterium]|nr:glycosyltransferase [Acidimicrobiales bacterium]
MRIAQYLPDLVPHDAISDHTRRLHAALVAAGHEASIHAAHVDRRLRREAQRWDPGAPPPDGVALYHASTGSPIAGWIRRHAAGGTRLALDYHNITPARYFDRWDPRAAARSREARRELAALAPWAELAVADSAYNEAELYAAGYARTGTCPLLVDVDAFRQPPDAGTLERLRSERARGGASWLFVGRLAPNKCQQDLIAALAVYRRLHDPAARLTLVGNPSSLLYQRSLEALAADLGVEGAVSMLTGVPHAELLAHFATADALVCLSEHEGFCAPLLEAMVVGTPIVALAATAVPETVADAGVLLERKDPLVVAEAVAALLDDPDRRAALLAAGRRRAEQLTPASTAGRMVRALESLG